MKKKILEILQKIVRFYFFPDQTPLTPTSFPGPTPHSKWGTDAEKNDELLKTSKDHSSVQKRSEYSVFLY